MRSKKEREKIKPREEESPPLLFTAFFTSHCSPLSERLEQAMGKGVTIRPGAIIREGGLIQTEQGRRGVY